MVNGRNGIRYGSKDTLMVSLIWCPPFIPMLFLVAPSSRIAFSRLKRWLKLELVGF